MNDIINVHIDVLTNTSMLLTNLDRVVELLTSETRKELKPAYKGDAGILREVLFISSDLVSEYFNAKLLRLNEQLTQQYKFVSDHKDTTVKFTHIEDLIITMSKEKRDLIHKYNKYLNINLDLHDKLIGISCLGKTIEQLKV